MCRQVSQVFKWHRSVLQAINIILSESIQPVSPTRNTSGDAVLVIRRCSGTVMSSIPWGTWTAPWASRRTLFTFLSSDDSLGSFAIVAGLAPCRQAATTFRGVSWERLAAVLTSSCKRAAATFSGLGRWQVWPCVTVVVSPAVTARPRQPSWNFSHLHAVFSSSVLCSVYT